MENPFTLVFGKEPASLIKREPVTSQLIQNLEKKNPVWQTCLITGVRGSGKTCMMTEIVNVFQKRADWITVDLTPQLDMIAQLTESLLQNPNLKPLFDEAQVELSLPGLGISLKKEKTVEGQTGQLQNLLQIMQKKGKKLLITVDDAVPNKSMRQLAGILQILIREKYPIYTLLTGLYENIKALKDDKSLTFLYRAWPVNLENLDMPSVARSYQKIFGFSLDEAIQMAKETKGYAFAYQLLGYLTFEADGHWEDVIDQYDSMLGQFVYAKLWEESSAMDRKVLQAVAESGPEVSNIRKEQDWSSSLFGQYRKRLIDRGILKSTGRGQVNFPLPRFKEFIEIRAAFEEA